VVARARGSDAEPAPGRMAANPGDEE
jgi:hypothetical protein